MYRIQKKVLLNPQTTLMEVEAPHIAQKAEPGQFIILRVHADGERIPLTISDFDAQRGTVTIIFQTVGKTTTLLSRLNEGDCILDLVGPLGTASHLEGYKKAVVIGGGLGTAIAYPQAKKLKQNGCAVDVICGFRNSDLIILEDKVRAIAHHAAIVTDDGSNGVKGFVTDMLRQLVEQGNQYDICIAIGPIVMMRAVANLTRELDIPTVVSMNPIMIDGTGMCGGCRVTVGGETRFACVDGPDFDGHQVDFDEAMRRGAMFREMEQHAMEVHKCRMEGMGDA